MPATAVLKKMRGNFDIKKWQKIGIGAVVIVAAYFTWTHGQLLPMSREEILAAQASNPLPPEWQEKYFGNKLCRRENYCGIKADPDRDNLSNYEEFLFYTDPTNPDSDGDGKKDGEEVSDLTNPIGAGDLSKARELNNIYENNPLVDEIISSGLEEIRQGNLMTVEQIQIAASQLTQLPNFSQIPFKISVDNSQKSIDKYVDLFGRVTNEFSKNEYAPVGQMVGEVTDLNKINSYIEAVALYATMLVYVDVPTDALEFHKAYYGSVVFQGLTAEVQKSLLEGKISEDEARDRFRATSIYYTRFMQDANAAVKKVQTKYKFPLDFSEN